MHNMIKLKHVVLFFTLMIGIPLLVVANPNILAQEPIPVISQPLPKPTAKPTSADSQTKQKIPATPEAPTFTMVDFNDFFDELVYCGKNVAVKTATIEGKIYGTQNDVCHFTLTPVEINQHLDCYMPTTTLVGFFSPQSQASDDDEDDNTDDEDDTAGQDSTSPSYNADLLLSNISQVMLYCKSSRIETDKPEEFEKQYKGAQ